MKTILLALALPIISLSHASAATLSDKSDWSSIRMDRRVTIVQPKFASVFGPLGLFNACATESELRSIHPVDVCVSYKVIRAGSPNTEMDEAPVKKCERTERQDVKVERTTTTPTCIRYAPETEESSNECIEWENVTTTLPTDHKLAVAYRRGYLAGERGGETLFKKTLVLPACE
ncbi:MAG: hypothetical protein ACXVLQ_13625 [Bacteriovorax sp.]